ncbi:MAG: hypothetical protein ACQEQE_01140 [Bacillota bacterium]
MKKCFLVLENGVVLNGESDLDKNVLGTVSIKDSLVNIECSDTNEKYKLNIANSNYNIDGVNGKLVTDDLPMDYHMFDIKTYMN